mgnify:FL=1
MSTQYTQDYEKNPEFVCCYSNKNDPRICVCGRDRAQCGKSVCAANVAHPAGMAITVLVYVAGIGSLVAAWIIRGDGK